VTEGGGKEAGGCGKEAGGCGKEAGRPHSPGNFSVNLGNTPVLALDVAPDDG
jgi:hypothetical protein